MCRNINFELRRRDVLNTFESGSKAASLGEWQTTVPLVPPKGAAFFVRPRDGPNSLRGGPRIRLYEESVDRG